MEKDRKIIRGVKPYFFPLSRKSKYTRKKSSCTKKRIIYLFIIHENLRFHLISYNLKNPLVLHC